MSIISDCVILYSDKQYWIIDDVVRVEMALYSSVNDNAQMFIDWSLNCHTVLPDVLFHLLDEVLFRVISDTLNF